MIDKMHYHPTIVTPNHHICHLRGAAAKAGFTAFDKLAEIQKNLKKDAGSAAPEVSAKASSSKKNKKPKKS